MTASATSSFIPITDPIGVKVAESHSRRRTHSNSIVSVWFTLSSVSPTKYPPVRSEDGQDCQEARDEALVDDMINPAGLSYGNLVGSGPRDPVDSFVATGLDSTNS